jgi:hypothetical protein
MSSKIIPYMNLAKKSLSVIIPLILAFGIFTNSARAQAGFGIRGGVNFANLNNTDVDSHTGLLLGLYFDNSIVGNLLLLQPAVFYTQKGFEAAGDIYRIDYIEIPVQLRFNFVNPTSILPFIYAGPYVGFKINTSFPGESVSTPAGVVSFNNGGNVKNTDFGVSVGGGIDFGHLNLGVRYDAGLTHVFKDSDAKNGVFSIVAGIGY